MSESLKYIKKWVVVYVKCNSTSRCVRLCGGEGFVSCYFILKEASPLLIVNSARKRRHTASDTIQSYVISSHTGGWGISEIYIHPSIVDMVFVVFLVVFSVLCLILR